MKTKQFFKKFGILILLVVLCAFFAIATEGIFIKADNLLNVARQVAMIGIASVGMAFVMITGGMDLSIGSLQGLLGVLTAMMMVNGGFPIWLAIICTLLIGVIAGVFHAFIYDNFNVPPMIITLAMYTSYRGLAYVISGGKPVFGFDEAFTMIGQGYLWFIPVPVTIMPIMIVIGWFILTKTSVGKYIYGLGGNEEACRLSGVNIRGMRYFIYAFSGFCAALAAVVLCSRVNSGQPKSGTGFEFEVITAIVLGGVSIKGGSGSIWGVLVGVLFMGVMKNGFILMNVNEYLQMVLQGFVLLAAVIFDNLMSKPAKLTKEKLMEEAAAKTQAA